MVMIGMTELKYFKWSDFACNCCAGNHTNPESAKRLDKAREISGVPFIVNSAYRCEVHNQDVGSKSSVHPGGYAFDIKATDSRSRYNILKGMQKAGFTRIGIAKTFIHCDDDPSKASDVIWVYS